MTRSMPPLIEAFLEMIAAERGASKNTLDAYARDLAGYSGGLAHVGKTPQDAATGDIRAYLSLLAKRGLKPASSARKLSSIRQFHRFLVADGRRSDDPALIVE
ncbi:MAG TPA: site-specific integrase, partial [Methylocella sp.]